MRSQLLPAHLFIQTAPRLDHTRLAAAGDRGLCSKLVPSESSGVDGEEYLMTLRRGLEQVRSPVRAGCRDRSNDCGLSCNDYISGCLRQRGLGRASLESWQLPSTHTTCLQKLKKGLLCPEPLDPGSLTYSLGSSPPSPSTAVLLVLLMQHLTLTWRQESWRQGGRAAQVRACGLQPEVANTAGVFT